MTEHEDQLRTAFENHEHLAPDAADVYGRVQELSRSYQRRRWGVQAGGAVLGVSLIAGAAFAGPALLSGGGEPQQAGGAAASMPDMRTPAKPSGAPASVAPQQTEQDKQWAAYFDAGYGYDEAVALAKIWKSQGDIGDVKAEAGRRLLAGETLPVRPSAASLEAAKDSKQLNAFFTADYTYEDAVKLAKLWKKSDPYAAKVEAGRLLLAGKKLPIKPSGAAGNPAGTVEAKRVQAFFNAGYDYDDAVKLAKLWKKSDPYAAKVEAGKRLLAGDTLPLKP